MKKDRENKVAVGQEARRTLNNILEQAIKLITLPYYLLYERNTRHPIVSIVQAVNTVDISHELKDWLITKNKEAQYVQVAGAVTFASAIGTLSWTNASSGHWSGPACWFSTIILSLTAVLSGAQQTILLESFDKFDLTHNRDQIRGHFSDPHGVRWLMVFAWQCPLMFLSYALIFYLAGLTSYVVSPVAKSGVWDDDAKTLVFYLVVLLTSGILFSWSSRLVHKTVTIDHRYPSSSNFNGS